MPLALSATNILTSSVISKFIFGVDDVTLGNILTAQEITAVELSADAASSQIQKYCDLMFISADYTEVWDGAATDEIIPREWPITAITSVKFAANGVFDDSAIIDSKLYNISNHGMSITFRNGMLTPRGRANVEVIYTAGYTTIPADLQIAALRQLQYLYKQIGKGDGMLGLKSIQKFNEGQSKDDSLSNTGLILEVEGMLKAYKRFECSDSVMFTRVT